MLECNVLKKDYCRIILAITFTESIFELDIGLVAEEAAIVNLKGFWHPAETKNKWLFDNFKVRFQILELASVKAPSHQEEFHR